MKLLRRRVLIVLSILLVIAIVVSTMGWLLYTRRMTLCNPESLGYTVKGVDVSEYQGDIDWNTLSNEGIQFAYIKATEGSSYVDSRFKENFQNAQGTNLRIGAYHFFSFESSGKTQAENFIANVPMVEDALPNVVDVELYGNFKNSPLEVETVVQELSTMLETLESYYGTKPIIYTTRRAYKLYIRDYFSDYSLWFRDVYSNYSVMSMDSVAFWQYSDNAVLNGYTGSEEHIDLDVFCGSLDDFNAYYR